MQGLTPKEIDEEIKKRQTNIGTQNESNGSQSARDSSKNDQSGYSFVNIVFNYFNEPEQNLENNQ